MRINNILFFISSIVLNCILTVNSISSHNNNNVNYLMKTFIANLKADYEIILKKDINTNIEEDINKKFATFLKSISNSDYEKNYDYKRGPSLSRKLKREITVNSEHKAEFGTYTLNGFEKDGIIPVNFPIDICLFEVKNSVFAAALHHQSPNKNDTFLIIYKRIENKNFHQIYAQKLPLAIAMDCQSMGTVGFVSIVNSFENSTHNPIDGSPVYQIQENHIEIVQYFTATRQHRTYLKKFGNFLYLFQIFSNSNETQTSRNCPVYKWSGLHFDLLDELPCTNARHIEPFAINSHIYVAVANFKDNYNDVDTFSFIYQFNLETNKFSLSQRIRTHGAVDIKYFYIKHKSINDENNNEIEHFLVVANSYEKEENHKGNYETQSIVYKFVNDYFMPSQTILLYNVTQFLPVMNNKGQFTLLISCKNQETKAWHYNGWKFLESKIQFTGGALGKGVSNLRTFKTKNDTIIVVANGNMLAEDTNLYVPKYTVENHNLGSSKETMNSCTETLAKLMEYDGDKMFEELKTYPTINENNEIVINDPIHLDNVEIETLTVDSLEINGTKLDQYYASAINTLHDINKQIEKRLQKVEQKLSTQSKSLKSTIAFDNLQSEAQIIQPEELPEIQLTEPDPEIIYADIVHVIKDIKIDFINDHPIADLLKSNQELNLQHIEADSIELNNRQNYKKLLSQFRQSSSFHNDSHDQLKSENDRLSNVRQVKLSDNLEELTVDELIVDGLINGIDLHTLDHYALKTFGKPTQTIDANFHIEHVEAFDVHNVNHLNVENIVRTTKGEHYDINQDIQFSSPVNVNRLYVKDRINNLRVINGKFDALLKESNETQIISAVKQFENVKLMEPIVLRGKIKSKSLEQINPIVSISEPIVLEGDYEISGNVTIKRFLRAENIIGASGKYSAHRLHTDGLLKNTTIIDLPVEFVQPIRTKHLQTGSINKINPHHFVKTNIEDIQMIFGKKTFRTDLHMINGYIEAESINNINVTELDESILKPFGDQVISGKIHFKNVVADSCTSKSATLWGHDLSEFLTKTDQIIPAKAVINGDLIVKNDIEIKHLKTNGLICDHNLMAIINDTILANELDVNVFGEMHFNETVTFDKIIVNGNLFKLGHFNELMERIQQVENIVELTGPFQFLNKVQIENLIFSQNINSISALDFGKQWLVKGLDQTFTAPQAFSIFESINGITSNGNVNGYNLNEYFQNTVWLNESKKITNAQFDQFISQQPLKIGGKISGIHFPDDLIFSESTYIQYFPKPLKIYNDMYVSKFLNISNTINRIPYGIACDFAVGSDNYGLEIFGNASFSQVPEFTNVNGRNLDELLATSWMANDNTVLTGNLVFSNADFRQPVTLNGTFNGYNLAYLQNSYFSVSKPQTILAPIEFQGNVFFENIVQANTVQLDGVIKCPNVELSKTSIDIEYFSRNVLRKNLDQTITGQWSIYEVIIEDDLTSTLINNLDVSTDIMRYSAPVNNVTAPKYFESISVEQFYCNGCTVQNVDLSEWIAKAALTYGNYTIQGTTTIENPIFYNDIRVFGLVNNMTFNTDSILLKDHSQEFHGNIHIDNQHEENNQITTLSIENVKCNTINDVDYDKFLNNLVYRDNAVIWTNMLFENRLTVDNLRLSGGGHWNGVDAESMVFKLQVNRLATNYTDHLEQLNIVGQSLANNFKNKVRYLESYKVIQTISGDIRKVVTLKIGDDTDKMQKKNIFALYSQNSKFGIINFYKWSSERKQIIIDKDLFALHPKNMNIIDIKKITFFNRDFLIIQTKHHHTGMFKHTFFTYLNKKFTNVFEIYSNASRQLTSMDQIDNSIASNCFAAFSEQHRNMQISCAFSNHKGVIDFTMVKEIQTPPLIQVKCLENELILLDVDGRIHVWHLDEKFVATQQQVIKTIHPIRQIAIEHYHGTRFIVACSQYTKNSIQYGSVEIFKLMLNEEKYQHVQIVGLDISMQAELSILPTGDLMLYTLTNSPMAPLSIYKYTGITNFQKFLDATTIPQGTEISAFNLNATTEIISMIVSGHGIMFIAAIMK